MQKDHAKLKESSSLRQVAMKNVKVKMSDAAETPKDVRELDAKLEAMRNNKM